MKFSHPKYKLGRISGKLMNIVLFTTMGIVFISAVKWRKSDMPISQVEIKVKPLGENNDKFLVKDSELKSLLLQKMAYTNTGVPLSSLRLNELENLILTNPFVKSADAYVDAQNRLKIHIEQKQPLARVSGINEASYYLDIDGKKMPLSSHYSARVPIITGNVERYKEAIKIKGSNLRSVYKTLLEIKKDPFLVSLIEQIDVKNNSIFLVPKIGKQTFEIGNADNLEIKFKNLKRFYKLVVPKYGWEKYGSINLSIPNQLIATKR
jgi:cell division protein FtsQ